MLIYCAKCEAGNSDEAPFCAECGNPLMALAQPLSNVTPTVNVVLTHRLGPWGLFAKVWATLGWMAVTASVVAIGGCVAFSWSCLLNMDDPFVDPARNAQLSAAYTFDTRLTILSATVRKKESGHPLFELRVRNDTGSAISQAFFHGIVRSPNRSVPCDEGDFYRPIPGGLEPSESATWEIFPGVFGNGWYSIPADRDDLELHVRVVRLEGPEGTLSTAIANMNSRDP